MFNESVGTILLIVFAVLMIYPIVALSMRRKHQDVSQLGNKIADRPTENTMLGGWTRRDTDSPENDRVRQDREAS